MTCKLCGLEHRGWVPCARAKFEDEKVRSTVETPGLRGAIEQDLVANYAVANETKVANRRGIYADKEKRKSYMRDLMRSRRAK